MVHLTGTVEDVDCVVIGAGPAGLAAAHELTRSGRTVLVLERGAGVGTSWRAHRPGLRLHTVRRLSGLPGLGIPRAFGRYVSSANLVRYLELYAEKGAIDVRFGVTVSRVERAGGSGHSAGWVVDTTAGRSYRAATLVVATGYNRDPFVPDLPGLDRYRRPYLHVAAYAGGDQFTGRDVLVVGAGNAAAEAATELVAAGAHTVRMAVRTTPHIVRRRIWGVSMQSIAILSGLLPVAAADRVAAGLARLSIPDLSGRGLTRPRPDLYSRVRRDRSVPVHDTGIVRLVREGLVTPVAAVVGFTPDGVRLADGTLVEPDVVVFATGYRRGLDSLIGGLGLLDIHGDPAQPSGTEAAPGLYFVGFTVSATGALRRIAGDARRVARTERRHAAFSAVPSGDQLRVMSLARLGAPDLRRTDAT
jgi:putative flavoprotein involved in K+ transport